MLIHALLFRTSLLLVGTKTWSPPPLLELFLDFPFGVREVNPDHWGGGGGVHISYQPTGK